MAEKRLTRERLQSRHASRLGKLPPIAPTRNMGRLKKVRLFVPAANDGFEVRDEPAATPDAKQYEMKIPIVIKKPKSMTTNRQCNFFKAASSTDTILTPIPDHWKEEQGKGLRPRPSQSEEMYIPEKPEERTDSIIDDTEGVLPRTFFPLGVDWDSRLDAMDYGKDVDVKSSSSGSSEADPKRHLSAEQPKDVYSVADWFRSARGKRESKTESLEGDSLPDEDILISRKAHSKDRLPSTSTERGGPVRLSRSFQRSRRRLRKSQMQRESVEKHYWTLNKEMRTDGPQSESGMWTTDEPAALHILRRATTETFRGREVIHNLLRKTCLKRSTTFQNYLNQLLAVKNELDMIDSVRKVTLTVHSLYEFCYLLVNNKKELVLQGKEVYTRLGRRIQDFDLPYIFVFLLRRPEIINLDLCYNNITSAGVHFIADYLSWDKSIISLNLMNNDIEEMDSYMIDALVENRTLKSLRLNGNPIGHKGGEFVSFLLMFKDLEHLDIGQTDQTYQSLAWISEALIQKSTLKILDLSRILKPPGFSNHPMNNSLIFADILRLNTSLVELHIPKNDLHDVDIEQIVFGLSFNKTLELLDVSHNQINDWGAEMLADSLQRGAPLKALMVAGNHITSTGARAFSYKLPHSKLSMLDLSNNKICDQGIIDIMSTIKKPKPLLALFIFGNPFGARALKMMAQALSDGYIDPKNLDIDIHYCEGVVGHGRNDAANRYKTRYYRSHGYRTAGTFLIHTTRIDRLPCLPGCADFKYHNMFNEKEITLPSPQAEIYPTHCSV